jgi:SPP1 family predicted phage head-tail adaptor
MRAGERDKRVTILAATTASDGRGGTVVTGWPALSPGWWVSIETLSAREFLQAGALQDTTTHLVRGLYRSDVTIKNRLYWGLRSLTFEIVARRELTTPVRELELECVEVDS